MGGQQRHFEPEAEGRRDGSIESSGSSRGRNDNADANSDGRWSWIRSHGIKSILQNGKLDLSTEEGVKRLLEGPPLRKGRVGRTWKVQFQTRQREWRLQMTRRLWIPLPRKLVGKCCPICTRLIPPLFKRARAPRRMLSNPWSNEMKAISDNAF